MKQWYAIIFSTLIFSFTGIPLSADAQCSCPNGDPIDSIVHIRTRSGILPFNSNIAFPKFSPDTGLLSCVRISGTVNTVLSMDLVNRDSTARVIYEMYYTRVTSLTGPGISVSAIANRTYGPYDLGQATVDVDTAVYIGPDTLFYNRFITQQTSNVVPYIGTSGNVFITYYNNGSYLMTQGNDNFGLNVAAASQVEVRVVYYWCPNLVLATSIERFSVLRQDGKINLQWATGNAADAKSYTVEFSTDGKKFYPVNEQQSRGAGSSQYSYVFDPTVTTGEMYFRIRQTDSRGKSSYSVVKALSFKENSVLNTTIYPNPAGRDFIVHFVSPQTGNLDIQLVNTAGQVLEKHVYKGTKSTAVKVNLQRQHNTGLYWLRIRNRETGEQSVTRLSLQ